MCLRLYILSNRGQGWAGEPNRCDTCVALPFFSSSEVGATAVRLLPGQRNTHKTMKQILCMKWGTAYSAKDVNILYGMVSRNVSGEFRFYCFTDDESGIREEVTCLPLPELGCEIPKDVPGKWPKSALWGKELFGLEGVALFIDLDTVIVDNIDGYFEYGDPQDVITARNWLYFRKSAQTSVFRFPIGGHAYMLENLRADSVGISRKYRFEQNYVTHGVKGGVKFWPEDWTKHFRVHCMGTALTRYFRPPVVPRGAKMITFPGIPKPENAAQGKWKPHEPVRTPTEHLKWVGTQLLGGKKWRRHLSRYIQKADWVGEHWRA